VAVRDRAARMTIDAFALALSSRLARSPRLLDAPVAWSRRYHLLGFDGVLFGTVVADPALR
jgi:hypothetical protein